MMSEGGQKESLQAETCDQEHRASILSYPILFPIKTVTLRLQNFRQQKWKYLHKAILHQHISLADGKISTMVIDALTEHAESKEKKW